MFQLLSLVLVHISSVELCKEVCMEIREVVSFHHLRVKFVTLQELHANNTRSLIRDL